MSASSLSLPPAAVAPFPAAAPSPLDPSAFDQLANGPVPPTVPASGPFGNLGTTAAQPDGGTADRAVLSAGLGLVRAARAKLKSTDPATAKSGRTQLVLAVAHLTGYLHGLGSQHGNTHGTGALPYPLLARPTLDGALDELEEELSAALLRVETRSLKEALGHAGDTLIAVGSILLTAGLAQPLV
jgi:hypothetical protein